MSDYERGRRDMAELAAKFISELSGASSGGEPELTPSDIHYVIGKIPMLAATSGTPAPGEKESAMQRETEVFDKVQAEQRLQKLMHPEGIKYPCGCSASEGSPKYCPEHPVKCCDNGNFGEPHDCEKGQPAPPPADETLPAGAESSRMYLPPELLKHYEDCDTCWWNPETGYLETCSTGDRIVLTIVTPAQPSGAQSAYAAFDTAVKFMQANGYSDWDGTADGSEITRTGCANMMARYLAAQPSGARVGGLRAFIAKLTKDVDDALGAHKVKPNFRAGVYWVAYMLETEFLAAAREPAAPAKESE